jgi:hypothetical protein
MKKYFLPLFLVLIFCTSLFGCKQETTTDFYLKWTKTHTAGYSEVCEYDIDYLVEYNQDDYNYSKANFATVSMTVKDGSYYKTTTTILTSINDTTFNVNVTGDTNTFYYKIENEQQVIIDYVIDGETLSFTDKLYSITYCMDCNNSLQPIFTYKSYDVTSVSSEYDKIIRYVYDVTTNYDGKNIKFTLTDKSEEKNGEYNYQYYSLQKATDKSPFVLENTGKDFIENETLLFAGRNLSLSKDETLNVSIPSYFGVKNVKIVPGRTGTISNTNYTINSLPMQNFPYVKTAICITGTNYTGSPMIVTYQKGAIEGTEYENCLMYNAISRLPSKMGALSYTLKAVTTN